VVLWGLVLVALLVTHLTSTGRFEVRMAANEVSAAVATAAADGAIHAAVFHLLDANEARQWKTDGVAHAVAVGDSDVTVQVWNDAGLINPNLAPPALLEALFRAVGVPSQTARDLAGAVAVWRDGSLRARTAAAGEADYRAAGKTYGPPGEPIEDLDEMARILGMTPQVWQAVKPHLSLWSPQEYPSAEFADPVVARALSEAAQSAEKTLPATAPVQRRRTVTIRARAVAPGGATVVREATLHVGPGFLKGFQVLSWGQTVD
jgi:general secretion pathway protein K